MPETDASAASALRIDGVTVRFGGLVAVNDVTLSVAPGEIVGIIGPNGAGKTTLLDAVSGFVALDGGDVVLAGRRVTTMLPYRRSRLGLARSFQQARLFPTMTVRETLLAALHPDFVNGVLSEGLGLPAARREERAMARRLDALLDVVDLSSYLDHRVAELSFGTTRALELACLAARRPSVLLLDEPASGLQQSEVRALGPLVERIRGHAAVVLIDHDVPFVSGVAHRLVAMNLGSVIADGEPDAVLGDPTVVSSYLGTGRYAEVAP